MTIVTNFFIKSSDIRIMKSFLSKYKTQVIAIGLGGLAGFSYYFFVGCTSGTCIITSNPFISTGYGSLLGFLLVGSFKKKENETA